jgi:KaiC/GvpD/RAD55 family RecA-like ATPase
MLFVGIKWKKRKDQPKSTGIEFLNKITEGGIPDSYSVMLVGSSDSGKNILFQELVHEFLKMEKPCVYVAYECFPDEIRENMKRLQWNTSTYESQGKLSFIDCFSSSAKVQSKEKHFLNQPFSLVDLGITISKATNEAGNGAKVFFDSLVPILAQLDSERVVDFLQDRIARVKGIQGNLIFTLNKESVNLALVSRLEEIVDCTIELDASQINGGIVRKLRIKKMRGRNFSDKWVRFEINPKRGIVFLI